MWWMLLIALCHESWPIIELLGPTSTITRAVLLLIWGVSNGWWWDHPITHTHTPTHEHTNTWTHQHTDTWTQPISGEKQREAVWTRNRTIDTTDEVAVGIPETWNDIIHKNSGAKPDFVERNTRYVVSISFYNDFVFLVWIQRDTWAQIRNRCSDSNSFVEDEEEIERLMMY